MAKHRIRNAIRALKGSRTENIPMNQLLDFLGVDKDLDSDALSEATYYTCLKLLSEAVAKLPIKLISQDTEKGVIDLTDNPLWYIIHDRPNPYLTATVFWGCMEWARNHYGNAYAFIDIRKGYNKPQLWILPPSAVQVWYDDARLLSDVPDIWYKYCVEDGNEYMFANAQILHLKTTHTTDNGLIGIPIRETLADTIAGLKKANRLINKLYDTGFTAKAVLQYTGDLNDANEQAYIKNIQKYMNGEMKEMGIENIIPLAFGSTLQPLNMKLSDSEFMAIKRYSALQIASAFGIKPTQIGDYSKASYSSSEAQQLSFYTDTLLYILEQYEQELTHKLLTDADRQKGMRFKFNIATVLRTDQRTQIETLSTAVGNFVYTPNEARAQLDLPSKEGGDKLLGNGAAIPVTMTGMQYVKDPVKVGEENGE